MKVDPMKSTGMLDGVEDVFGQVKVSVSCRRHLTKSCISVINAAEDLHVKIFWNALLFFDLPQHRAAAKITEIDWISPQKDLRASASASVHAHVRTHTKIQSLLLVAMHCKP